MADSPVVATFSLQLFPRKLGSAHHLSRNPDLFAAVVLGKHGLPAIRKHISEHRTWRADNAVYTSRVVESSISKETLPTTKTSCVHMSMHAAPGTASGSHPLTLTQFLKDRQLQSPKSHASFARVGPTILPETTSLSPASPRTRQIEFLSPSKAHLPLGSFGANVEGHTTCSFLPALGSSASASEPKSSSLPPLVSLLKGSMPQADPVLKDQLRKEERVLEALSAPSKLDAQRKADLEKQLRRRHGRPPPKIVENRGMFIDEHAFTPVANLKQEHDRKKSGLCRRLLHFK